MSDPFYRSAEIRWFLPGQSQQDQLFNWFRLPGQEVVVETQDYVSQPKAAPFVKQERVHTDEYLLLPDCDTVSVKQRQGKLEVKALVAGPHPFALDTVVGRLDQWVKWSFRPSDKTFQDGITLGKQLGSEFDQSGPWQAVTKVRYLQKYSFDMGQPVAVSPDLRPNSGCQIELTRISVQATVANWLTFGFEAFGSSEHVTTILEQTAQEFFSTHDQSPLPLNGRDSLSYPAWLVQLR